MRDLRLVVAGLVGLGLVGGSVRSAAAQAGVARETAGRIDAAAAEVLASTGVPSLSVAVVAGGKVAYVRAYGRARLEPAMEATPAMQYSIGSVSKQFTAALMLLLAQDGKLRLDEPVGKYLPDLTRSGEVTIRQVLSMTSGYQDFWPEDYLMTSMMKPTTPGKILAAWGKKPLDFDPGTQWQYSNTNYVIAGRIAEIAGGKPLLEQLQERIFRPLKMTGVLNSDANRLPATDPTGYYRHALAPLRPSQPGGAGWMFAAGELAMSPGDLALWNISLMDRTLLQAASYDEMFSEVTLKNGKGTGYGLGVDVGERGGRKYVAHSGEVSGFVAQNTVLPEDKVAITVLTNEDATGAAALLEQKIEPLVLGGAAAGVAEGTAAVKVAEARAKEIFTELQAGRIDRGQLTGLCNDYFTAEALGDFASSLKGLGVPTGFRQVRESKRGGMTFRVFQAEFPGRMLQVTEYEEPDGKLEQYLVIAPGS